MAAWTAGRPGPAKSTSFCLSLDSPLTLPMSGDFLTCATKMAAVSVIVSKAFSYFKSRSGSEICRILLCNVQKLN